MLHCGDVFLATLPLSTALWSVWALAVLQTASPFGTVDLSSCFSITLGRLVSSLNNALLTWSLNFVWQLLLCHVFFKWLIMDLIVFGFFLYIYNLDYYFSRSLSKTCFVSSMLAHDSLCLDVFSNMYSNMNTYAITNFYCVNNCICILCKLYWSFLPFQYYGLFCVVSWYIILN